MTKPLLSAIHAASELAEGLTADAFQRLADRHKIPYHKIGRDRYYSADVIPLLAERTMRCPESEEDHDSTGARSAGSSAGQKTDALASAAQALQIAERLKANSRTSSRKGGRGRSGAVVSLRTS
jgi:hypothetical protein